MYQDCLEFSLYLLSLCTAQLKENKEGFLLGMGGTALLRGALRELGFGVLRAQATPTTPLLGHPCLCQQHRAPQPASHPHFFPFPFCLLSFSMLGELCNIRSDAHIHPVFIFHLRCPLPRHPGPTGRPRSRWDDPDAFGIAGACRPHRPPGPLRALGLVIFTNICSRNSISPRLANFTVAYLQLLNL